MIAFILAQLMGKVTPRQARQFCGDQYERLYNDAYKLYKDSYIAIQQDGVWMVVKHPPKWIRRIR